ncbi:unnamed protein product [Prorocentrum cordatum]|uniref:Uncharacterized protein n=1 Tax=Prorocentrum cordatum TaxID=2364126 RepID=A0ABN9W4V2_9DINO|nr:unnamed protein product [Polarella glacialis]
MATETTVLGSMSLSCSAGKSETKFVITPVLIQEMNISTASMLNVEVRQTVRQSVSGTALRFLMVTYSDETTGPQKAAELATSANSMAADQTSLVGSLTTAFADVGITFDASSAMVSPPSTNHVAVAAAIGDPHIVNMYGQRFDIRQAGTYALIQIPRGSVAERSLLAAEARAERSGRACSDLCFKSLNLTCTWVDELIGAPGASGGFGFSASASSAHVGAGWLHIRRVDVAVSWGHTAEGVECINVSRRHSGRAGFPVGGLLGDGSKAAAPNPHCRLSLSFYNPLQAPHS